MVQPDEDSEAPWSCFFALEAQNIFEIYSKYKIMWDFDEIIYLKALWNCFWREMSMKWEDSEKIIYLEALWNCFWREMSMKYEDFEKIIYCEELSTDIGHIFLYHFFKSAHYHIVCSWFSQESHEICILFFGKWCR